MAKQGSWYDADVQFKREGLDLEREMRTRQLDLQERQMRLQNDPYRTLLNTLATAGPQVAFQTLGNVAVDAAKFKLFGGEEKLGIEQETLDMQKENTKSLAKYRASENRAKRFQEALQGDAESRAQFKAMYGMADVPMVDGPGPVKSLDDVKSLLQTMPNRKEEQGAFFKGLSEKSGQAEKENYVQKWYQQKQKEMGSQPTQPKKVDSPQKTPPTLATKPTTPTYRDAAESSVRAALGYSPTEPLFKAHGELVTTTANAMQTEGRKKTKAVVTEIKNAFVELRKKQLSSAGTPGFENDLNVVTEESRKLIESLPPQEQDAAVQKAILASKSVLKNNEQIEFERTLLASKKGAGVDQYNVRGASNTYVNIGNKELARQSAKDADSLHEKMENSKLLVEQALRRGDQSTADKHMAEARAFEEARDDAVKRSEGLRKLLPMEDGTLRYVSAKPPGEMSEALSDAKKFAVDPLGTVQALVNNMENAATRAEWQKLVDSASNDTKSLQYLYDSLKNKVDRSKPGYDANALYQDFTTSQKAVVNKFFKENTMTPEQSFDVMTKLKTDAQPTSSTNEKTLKEMLDKYKLK